MNTKAKIDHLKRLLSSDAQFILDEVLQTARYAAYDAGFVDSVELFALWKNGEQLVGSQQVPLKRVLATRKTYYSYAPDNVDITTYDP